MTCFMIALFAIKVTAYVTSKGDLRRKQSNHKSDQSMKSGQSVCLFGQLLLLVMLVKLDL